MMRSTTVRTDMDMMDVEHATGTTCDTDSFDSNTTVNAVDVPFNEYKLASGGFATAWRVGENMVKKTLSNNTENGMEEFRKEARLMMELNHRNIVKFMHFDAEKMDLFMEYCGASLFDMIEQHNGFGDSRFRDACIRQILFGVAYLHAKGIAHMYLKLENVCCGPNGIIKIIDFGLASKAPKGRRGSVSYAAPEVMGGIYFNIKATDMWSVGVMLFVMTYGFFPFEIASKQDWRFNGIIGTAKVTMTILGYYSNRKYGVTNCEDIIDNLLIVQPEQRMTVQDTIEMLSHKQ